MLGLSPVCNEDHRFSEITFFKAFCQQESLHFWNLNPKTNFFYTHIDLVQEKQISFVCSDLWVTVQT
jgi:hypothetical protein